MKRRGRPVLGAVCGLLLGVFLALDLHMLHIWTLSKASETVLPVAGLVVGLALGLTGPVKRQRTPSEHQHDSGPVPDADGRG